MRSSARAIAALILGLFTALAPATSAAAGPIAAIHPLLADHRLVSRVAAQPPTTADCVSFFGLACYGAPQMQKAYNLQPLYNRGLDGRGRTIVIVDAFGSPTIGDDLRTFDAGFGLPDPPSLSIITPAGTLPAFNPNDNTMVGWALETTLDVEWAHAIAPGANILLVETPVAETEGVQGFPEIVQAENYVINHHLGDVISQSFGATEETFPSNNAIRQLRSAFKNADRHHVSVLASSGDTGSTDFLFDGSCCYPFAVNSWPSADPLVTSIGGTQLHLDATGQHTAPDNVWNDGFAAGGGGPSHVFDRPSFQDGVRRVVGSTRATPDISMSGACDGGVLVWFAPTPAFAGWYLVCGTSESSPLFAGIVAIAAQLAGHSLGNLNETLYDLHGRHDGVVDVTSGNNGFTFCQSACGTAQEVDVTVPGFPAMRGYDMSSGIGTIDAARFVPALAEESH